MAVKTVEIFVSSGSFGEWLRPVWPVRGDSIPKIDTVPLGTEGILWREQTIQVEGASLHGLSSSITLYHGDDAIEFPLDDTNTVPTYKSIDAWARTMFGEDGRETVRVSYS